MKQVIRKPKAKPYYVKTIMPWALDWFWRTAMKQLILKDDHSVLASSYEW